MKKMNQTKETATVVYEINTTLPGGGFHGGEQKEILPGGCWS
jgi:hypothetical protein